jgi:hypothetical protein
VQEKNMQNSNNHDHATQMARALTPEAFAMLGAPQLAYVAPIATEQGHGFAIHAANGNLLAVLRSRELAFATAKQNDLEAVSVH